MRRGGLTRPRLWHSCAVFVERALCTSCAVSEQQVLSPIEAVALDPAVATNSGAESDDKNDSQARMRLRSCWPRARGGTRAPCKPCSAAVTAPRRCALRHCARPQPEARPPEPMGLYSHLRYSVIARTYRDHMFRVSYPFICSGLWLVAETSTTVVQLAVPIRAACTAKVPHTRVVCDCVSRVCFSLV